MIANTINWKQFRSLLKTSFLIEARGRSAKKPYNRAFSLLFSYALSSTYLAWNLSRVFYEPAYVLISFTVYMYLVAFTVINSYSFILLDTADDQILMQFPISRKTIFAVRSTNLFIYIFLISVPFYIPLGIYFGWYASEPWTVVYYIIVLFLASIWTTCFFLIIYNLIVKWFANSTQIFSFTQIIFILFLLFFYQTLPSFDATRVEWHKILAGAFPYYFPPIWFCSMLWSIQGFLIIDAQTVTLLFGSVTLITFLLFLRSPLILLPTVKAVQAPSDDGKNVRHDPIYRFMTTFCPREVFRKAGFDFFRTMFFRDRILQLQVLPVIMMPLAIAIFGILTQQLGSPMQQNIISGHARIHITVMFFYLLSARHIIQTIIHTRHADGRWIFMLSDSFRLERYTKGVYHGVMFNLLLPLAIGIFILFLWTMPLVDAVLHTTFLFLGARFQIATWSVFQPHVPFSMHEDKFSSMQRFTHLFFVIPYFGILMAFHYMASVSVYSFIIFLLSLEISTFVCLRYLKRKSYAVSAES